MTIVNKSSGLTGVQYIVSPLWASNVHESFSQSELLHREGEFGSLMAVNVEQSVWIFMVG